MPKYAELLRAQVVTLEEQRGALLAEIDALAADESRSADEITARADEITAEAKAIGEDIAKKTARADELDGIEAERAAAVAKAPAFIRKPDAPTEADVRSMNPTQLSDAVTRGIEARGIEDVDHARKILKRHTKADPAWAANLLARTSETYLDAWSKYVTGRSLELTEEERTALSTLTSANGGYLLPTHLDPSIILTNDGSSNAVRRISRVVTLTEGKTWNGITSAGVTASWDAELTEVSDDSPTFGNPQISVHAAQALVQASFYALEDIAGLPGDILMMFADAKDRLEGAAHCTGSGSDQPYGIFTALDANTNVEMTSTTAATIGVVDLHAAYNAVPVRWRAKGKWLMNPIWNLAIKELGTAVSASYTTDLTQAPAGAILGKEVVESDDAPETVTTTVRDNRFIYGDFSNYVIVDKPGSMSVEFIPTLFNTANNLPDGRRAWHLHWRTGADSVNDVSFRLMQDKTSA